MEVLEFKMKVDDADVGQTRRAARSAAKGVIGGKRGRYSS